MFAFFARLVLFLRAEINWRRGVRLATCPGCGDINTDDLLPDNPEPAYCLTCATARANGGITRPPLVLARTDVARAPEHRAVLLAAQIVEADYGAPVRVRALRDTLSYYDAQGRIIMERDPVRHTITVNGETRTYEQMIHAHDPLAVFSEHRRLAEYQRMRKHE